MKSKISPQQIIPDQFNNFNPASYSITYPSDLNSYLLGSTKLNCYSNKKLSSSE